MTKPSTQDAQKLAQELGVTQVIILTWDEGSLNVGSAGYGNSDRYHTLAVAGAASLAVLAEALIKRDTQCVKSTRRS